MVHKHGNGWETSQPCECSAKHATVESGSTINLCCKVISVNIYVKVIIPAKYVSQRRKLEYWNNGIVE